jgi:hypothetical protein
VGVVKILKVYVEKDERKRREKMRAAAKGMCCGGERCWEMVAVVVGAVVLERRA